MFLTHHTEFFVRTKEPFRKISGFMLKQNAGETVSEKEIVFQKKIDNSYTVF